MASNNKRWAQHVGHTPVPPHFEALRHALRHLLLGELQHTLLLNLALPAKKHFQGLAAAAKFHKGMLDNRLAAKLRLVDDSHHLLEHLTPESAANFVQEIGDALAIAVGDTLSSSALHDASAFALCLIFSGSSTFLAFCLLCLPAFLGLYRFVFLASWFVSGPIR